MKASYQVISLGVVAALVGAIWHFDALERFGIAAEKSDSARGRQQLAAPKVIVRQVRFASDAAVVQAVGTGKAVRAVVLHPEAEGRVTHVLFQSGQKVKAGQPLIRLENDEEKLAVKLATVNLENAQRLLKRYERIKSDRAITLNQFEAARKAYDLAEIALSKAKLELSRRTLTAPFDGVIGIAKIEAGDRVTKTTQIANLDDRSALLVDFEIPAAFAFGVRRGSKFTATTWARRSEKFSGTVTDLGSRVNQQTRTLRVRGRIPNDRDRLRTGLAFSITLPLAGKQYPSVPSVAIRWRRKGSFVWTVREGVARRVSVDVIKRNGGWVLVDAKLKADDVVVIEGVQRLRPGRKVRIEKRTARKQTKAP